jgi:hypothetical protein
VIRLGGKDAKVSIDNANRNILIEVPILIRGTGASPEIAKYMNQYFKRDWDNGGKGWNVNKKNWLGLKTGDKWHISVDPQVSFSDRGRGMNTVDIYSTLEEMKQIAGDTTSRVDGGNDGKWRGFVYKGAQLLPIWEHEFGHFLRLGEEYLEGHWDENGDNPPLEGWDGNIMADSRNGKVTIKNIELLFYQILQFTSEGHGKNDKFDFTLNQDVVRRITGRSDERGIQ